MTRPTVHDIAKVAGVSLATVDRVLNARPGVRAQTIAKVQGAIERLGYVRDTHAANLARGRRYRFAFALPDGRGQFLQALRAAVEEAAVHARSDRTDIALVPLPIRDHLGLVQTLDRLDHARIDGLAIFANETPYVRDTIARLKAGGTAVVTLVSDQPQSSRDRYVGFDNVAAGRTAATLLGRFLAGRVGSIAVVATSMQARDMIERRLGFDAVLRARFPALRALPSIEAHDDPDLAERLTRACLDSNADAVGLYSVGASVEGIGRVLRDRPPARRLVAVDHELTPNSRTLLEDGLLDAVITQNPGHLARSALRVLRAHCDGTGLSPTQERIRIDIVIKENLPAPEEEGT